MARKPALLSKLANFLEERRRSHPANFEIYGTILTAVIGGLILAAVLWLPKSLSGPQGAEVASNKDSTTAPKPLAVEPEPSAPVSPKDRVRIRDTVGVLASDPVIHPCVIATSKACFRLPIQISTKNGNDLQAGYNSDGPAMAGTHAIFGNGTACKGYPVGGLSFFSDVVDVDLQIAAPDRPITGVIEFGCDGELFAEMNASVQIVLSVARAGIEQQKARFNLADLALKADGQRNKGN